jgi:alkyl sulfatase BDS1-like metallo-beta-lactamase superfamily hydrolase
VNAPSDSSLELGPKPPTAHTVAANRAALDRLATASPDGRSVDRSDVERVMRGLVAQHPTGRIEGANGHLAVDVNELAFLDEPAAPDSVHPALWEQARLNRAHGLFEVAPRLWQVRGYDISNITFIAGDTGWIVIDPLTSVDSARASLALANEHLGERPVVAVIYTHSHVDHFGGVLGVTTEAEVQSGQCIVVAPVGFLHEAVSENLLAGPIMNRRSSYQFGTRLPASPLGYIDCGLGKRISTAGISLIAPTHDITETGQEMLIDGVRVIFQLTPEAEAPAEMNFYFPQFRWLCTAENCTHTMHNLVPIRGAKVRDSLAWSKYANEALHRFGAEAELVFASHHWPRWGNADVREFLRLQRDLYRWMHDQTLRFANKGMTPQEIAEHLELPPEFQAQMHTRGFYGDLVHNVKAVFQRYLSWYDGNPSRLHGLPPVEAGRRYVEFMGGIDEVLLKASASFDAGDYRWVAEVMNHAVFAYPDNRAARALQADALEQLGYQAQSATFRNAYLTGAMELRQGPPPVQGNAVPGHMLRSLSVEQVFELLAVRLKSEEVGGLRVLIGWEFTDVLERWTLELSNRTLNAYPAPPGDWVGVDVSVTMTAELLRMILAGRTTFIDGVTAGTVTLSGDPDALRAVFANLDQFTGGQAIVEP